MSTYLDPRVGMSLGHALEGSPRSRSHVTRPRARSPVTRPRARSPSSELRTAGSATWPELMPPRGPSAPCPSASATNKGTLPLRGAREASPRVGRVRYRPYLPSGRAGGAAYPHTPKKSRRRDRYLCVACRPHTRPQRFSPRRRELARAPQTHHTHRKPRHPTLASRSERECAPLQHAAHVTQAMSSSTSTHHVASNAHKAPRNAPGTLSRPSRAHSNAPIPAQ